MNNLGKYNELKNKGLILFESIVGSQAYGTNLPTSDIDKKFIFIDTLDNILAGTQTDQLDIDKDYVGYELGRYLELLAKQNPNIHELLWSPDECILHCDPTFKEVIINKRKDFISKKVRFSFGAYASAQIQKARGLNKKIVTPIAKEKKTILDFCWIPYKQGSINVVEWLNQYGLKQEYCGLVAIDHMHYTYHLFYDFPSHTQDIPFFSESDVNKVDSFDLCTLATEYFIKWDSLTSEEKYYNKIAEYDRLKYKGIIQKDNASNDISLSAVLKGMKPLSTMYFNLEGYTKYCKDYTEYWKWVENRNEERYQNNLSHGASYDSKNMAHCHRLLDTCIEAMKEGVINVRRPNRKQLLEIRAGKYPYDQLIKDAEEKIKQIDELYETTSLPEEVDQNFLKEVLLEFRKKFYNL